MRDPSFDRAKRSTFVKARSGRFVHVGDMGGCVRVGLEIPGDCMSAPVDLQECADLGRALLEYSGEAQAQEIQDLRAARDKSEAEVKRLRGLIGSTHYFRKSQIQDLRAARDQAREDRDFWRQYAAESDGHMDEAQAQIQDLRAQLADRTAEVKDLDRALEQLELERQKVRDKLVRARRLNWVNRHETANLIQELCETLASERQTNLELGALAIKRKAQLKDAVENEDRLRRENADLRSQRDALLSANDELRKALAVQS